jgi:hypothetical protein
LEIHVFVCLILTQDVLNALTATHVPSVPIPSMNPNQTYLPTQKKPPKVSDGDAIKATPGAGGNKAHGFPVGPVRALAMPKFVTIGHSAFDAKMTQLRGDHDKSLELTNPPAPPPSVPAARQTLGVAALPNLDGHPIEPPPPPSISERIASHHSPGVRLLSSRLALDGRSLLPIASNGLFGTLPASPWSDILQFTLDVSLLGAYLAPELLDEAFRLEEEAQVMAQTAKSNFAKVYKHMRAPFSCPCFTLMFARNSVWTLNSTCYIVSGPQ